MKIIRHTARDMRQALRGVREQLGEDAVILSSRRTGEGVEMTAAIDFDAATLESGGFAAPSAPFQILGDASGASGSRHGGLPELPHFAPRAKRVLCLFQSGGLSHVDLFDDHPALQRHAGQEIPPSRQSPQRLL